MKVQTIVGMKKKALALGGVAAVLVGMGSCGDGAGGGGCTCPLKFHPGQCNCNGVGTDCTCVTLTKANDISIGVSVPVYYHGINSTQANAAADMLKDAYDALPNAGTDYKAALNNKIKEIYFIPSVL